MILNLMYRRSTAAKVLIHVQNIGMYCHPATSKNGAAWFLDLLYHIELIVGTSACRGRQLYTKLQLLPQSL